MSRGALSARVAVDLKCSRLQADLLVRTVLANIEKLTCEHGRLTLVGFGTFRQRSIRARAGRNPHTGEPIQIPARKRLAFTASKAPRKIAG